jgi:hypothetical protein
MPQNCLAQFDTASAGGMLGDGPDSRRQALIAVSTLVGALRSHAQSTMRPSPGKSSKAHATLSDP